MTKQSRLDFDIEHLAATVHAVSRIYAMGAEKSAVLCVFRELWQCESSRTTAFAAALLRLFAFWLSHGVSVIELKC